LTQPWGAQIKATFRDISGIQKNCEMVFINKRREGDNWDRDATRVFHLPIKVIDKRTDVETDDVITCQPDYDAPSQGATPTKFARLPTSKISHQITIGIELKGGTAELSIASDASTRTVEDKARILWGQAAKSVEPPPIP
jgi:hypothetical protein